jgi:PTH1 family peptidyl-tRNA hydrolase
MLMVCDDFNLPLDSIRLRPGGSGGGQNGLADVLTRLGTTTIPRLRLGIGPVPKGWKSADFVLGKFSAEERTRVEVALERAADAAEAWAGLGIQAAMNTYN